MRRITNRVKQWLLGGETLAGWGLAGALWFWSHCSPTLTERRRNGVPWRKGESGGEILPSVSKYNGAAQISFQAMHHADYFLQGQFWRCYLHIFNLNIKMTPREVIQADFGTCAFVKYRIENEWAVQYSMYPGVNTDHVPTQRVITNLTFTHMCTRWHCCITVTKCGGRTKASTHTGSIFNISETPPWHSLRLCTPLYRFLNNPQLCDEKKTTNAPYRL